jgi:hypothetical protein
MNQPIKDVIVAACEELDCTYDDYAAWFMILIESCLKTIKSSKVLNHNLKTKVKVYDNRVVLDSSVLSVEYVASESAMTLDNIYTPHIDYVIQSGVLIFTGDTVISDDTYVYIQYTGLAKDENGDIIFNPSWERMLIAYIGWKYCRRYIKEKGPQVMESFHKEFRTQKLANI